MIIEDPNVVGVHPLPSEDEAPALIDPHAVIAPEIAFQWVQPPAGYRFDFVDRHSHVQSVQHVTKLVCERGLNSAAIVFLIEAAEPFVSDRLDCHSDECVSSDNCQLSFWGTLIVLSKCRKVNVGKVAAIIGA